MTEIRKKKKNYINNADLLKEIEISHRQNRMTEELGKMVLLLCQRYVQIPRFAKYTYTDDMQGFALMTLCKVWKGFDATKSQNPFAYFTQCIHNAYFQFNNQERKQRDIKDEIRINSGLNASFNYADRTNAANDEHDATGDRDSMDIHDSIDPYKEDLVYDPKAPGEVITLDPSEIKILEIGAEFFGDDVTGED
jgi:hypothetical protein